MGYNWRELNMLKKSTLLFLLSMLIMNGHSQSKIGDVYGVSLGDSKYSVESGIKAQGKNGEWKYSSSSQMDYYHITNVKIGNCWFDTGNFFIKDNKLCRVVIGSGDHSTLDPSHPSNPLAKFENNASKYRRNFEELADLLNDKYGTPFQSSSNMIVWKDDGRKIVLKYSYSKEKNMFGGYDVGTGVSLIYEIIDVSQGNY